MNRKALEWEIREVLNRYTVRFHYTFSAESRREGGSKSLYCVFRKEINGGRDCDR